MESDTIASGSSSQTPGACPDREVWPDFVLGRVSDDDLERLESHLEGCASCQDTLEDLGDVRDEVIVGLRLPARDDDILNDPALGSSISDGRDTDGRSGEDAFDGAGRDAILPESIGRFRIREYAGSGGFGVVFRAYDPTSMREVALKVPLVPGPLTGSSRFRFLRERGAVSRLNHPNITILYEAAEADGIPYLALEYCQGPTLAARLADEGAAFSFSAAAALIVTLAEAVQHAHGQGVLHRDIKPSNVILTPRRPESGQGLADLPFIPKLTDFGLAKLILDEAAGTDQANTRADVVLGTPEYMAPEQAGARGGVADERTDVYALGVLLYQLLTGSTPFRGKDRPETLQKVVGEEPEPPGRRRRGVPRDLQVICLKCLEKPKERRYDTAALLADDLRRYLAGETIRARSAGVLERSWKSARRRPIRTILLSAAVLLAGVVLVDHWRLQRAVGRAEASERKVVQRLYAANIRQAWQTWRDGRPEDFETLLRRCLPDPGLPATSDPRGFEWYFLKRLAVTPRRERTLRAHSGGAFYVRYSPDGTLLATGGGDGLVKLWNPATGQAIASLSGHRGDINSLAFSPDGKTLASVGDDRTARLWDVQARRVRHILGDHPDRVFHVAFSPDGRLLATGDRGPDIRIWDPSSGGLIERLGAGKVKGLAFFPTGRKLLSAHEDLKLRVWDLSQTAVGGTGRRPSAFATVQGAERISQVTFAPDGNTFASPMDTGAVHLWNAEQLEVIRTLHGHIGVAVSAVHSADGKRIATGGRDTNVRIWEADGTPIDLLAGHSDDVVSLMFSPDGSTLASASKDGTVKLWNRRERADWDESIHLPGLAASLMNWVAITNDGSRIINCGIGNAPVQFRSIPEGNKLVELAPMEGFRGSACLATSPDGRWIAAGVFGNAIGIWDAADRTLATRLRGVENNVDWLVFSPAGAMLAVGDGTKTVWLWDWRLGRLVASLDCVRGTVFGMAFSPDGRTLVTPYNQVDAALWDVRTLRPRVWRTGHNELMRCAAFSPDGETLATGSHDQTIKLWNAASGQLRETLRGHVDWIEWLTFSPDGKTLVSGSRDGTVKFWQTATGLELLSADHIHTGRVACGSFDAKGHTLLTGSRSYPLNQAEIRLWRTMGRSRD